MYGKTSTILLLLFFRSVFTGTVLWTLHHHIPLTNLSLPRRLPDLDGDGAPDLVSACAVVLPSGIGDRAHPHPRTDLVSAAQFQTESVLEA